MLYKRLIFGDFHGHFNSLNQIYQDEKPYSVIHLGDYFDNFHGSVDSIKDAFTNLLKLREDHLSDTKNGDFKWSMGTTGVTLATSDGLAVLDTNGNPIVLPEDVPSSQTAFTTTTGELGYLDNRGQYVSLNAKIGTWQFNNPAGLEKVSGSRYALTDASGAPMDENTTPGLTKSNICNTYLEASNVQVADEMVNLIVAQRAYEMNSKAIQAADDMLGQANSLKR